MHYRPYSHHVYFPPIVLKLNEGFQTKFNLVEKRFHHDFGCSVESFHNSRLRVPITQATNH